MLHANDLASDHMVSFELGTNDFRRLNAELLVPVGNIRRCLARMWATSSTICRSEVMAQRRRTAGDVEAATMVFDGCGAAHENRVLISCDARSSMHSCPVPLSNCSEV